MSLAEQYSDDRRRYPFVSPSEERELQLKLLGVPPAILEDNGPADPRSRDVVHGIEQGLRDLTRTLSRSLGPSPRSHASNASNIIRHPIDLDEARAGHLRPPQTQSAKTGAAPVALAVPADYAPRKGGRPAILGNEAEDVPPSFLQRSMEALPAERVARSARPPITRGSAHHPDLPRSLDPIPMMMPPRRPAKPKGSLGRAASALALAYAALALIPLTTWVSDIIDPRLAAAAPAIYFTGWLTVHGWRRDQMPQLRLLAAWQIFQMISALYAMRPAAGLAHTGIYWSATITATGAALYVVAVSAVIEASEFRSGRLTSAPRPPGGLGESALAARRPRGN